MKLGIFARIYKTAIIIEKIGINQTSDYQGQAKAIQPVILSRIATGKSMDLY
jgi:hypothetical protein